MVFTMTDDELQAIERRAQTDFYARAFQDVMALVGEVRRLQQSDAERFKLPEGSAETQICAYVGKGLVCVPMKQAERGDPRTVRMGPLPPGAEQYLEILVLPSTWVCGKGFLKDVPDQEMMRSLLK